MLFSSIPFLYYFLPITLLMYFIAPKKFRNTVLLLASLIFYAWGGVRYVLLMVVSILIGYISGLLIEKAKTGKTRKFLMIVSVVFELSLLIYFKYADFFISNFNAATGLSVSLLNVVLPIGISFYTFQILSYIIDVYRKEVPAQKNVISLATYIALFPQLIAGPIVRYSDIEKQLNKRTISFDKIYEGAQRFIIGLSKKILIANQLGEFCNIFRDMDEKTVLFHWGYAIAFTLHIYFDFSGYSDMAIGLGKVLGFEFLENFNYPYISKSITEFWRRWHMSLGTWFRDYVYIPLGGNRVSKSRHIINIIIVWMLTGFWHGAAWNFILWGLMFAVLLIVEKFLFAKKKSKENKENLCVSAFKHVYVLFFVIISFVLFNSETLGQAMGDIKGMFGMEVISFSSEETLYYLRSYLVVFIISVIGSLPLAKSAVLKLSQSKGIGTIVEIIKPILLVILLLLSTAYLVDGSFNPFLYFRF